MSILPKAIYRFTVISVKTSMAFFTELKQVVQTFVWKHRRPWIAKAILRKKNKAGGIMPHDFQLYYKVITTKTVWYWQKKRQINRTEWSPEIHHAHMVSLTGGNNIQWGKSLFNKWYWENWTATCKRVKMDHFLTPHSKINSKLIKDKYKTTELLEKYTISS